MKTHSDLKRLFAVGLLAAAGALASSLATAQTSNDAMVAPAAASKQAREIVRGDPVRWYREDATAQQRWRTRQKEIGAALDEAKNACRQGPAAERATCLKAAQDTWKEEMAAARAEAGVQPGTRTQ
jgi:Tfp pilus assembly protein PilV